MKTTFYKIIPSNFLTSRTQLSAVRSKTAHIRDIPNTYTHIVRTGVRPGGMEGTVLSSFLFTKIILGDGSSSIFFF